jgi:NAD(P)-dependent dehydrogenase (short-subunit alcohol dehydrogenase family)
MTVKRVGIVGSGIMGSGIAEVAAKAGIEVVLRSRAQATADAMVAGLEKSLAKQVDRGKLEANDRDAVLGRVRAVTDLHELSECDLVIESIVEDLAAKKHLFTELDRICADHAIIATNTSTLPVIELAMETGRPDRVCGVHFFNPAPMMSLVEVVRPITASDATIATALAFAAACGKDAVEVAGDGQDGVVERFSLKTLRRTPPDEAVVGIDPRRSRHSARCLPVGGGSHDQPVHPLQAPRGTVGGMQQLAGEPVEQFRMRGKAPLKTEVAGCPHQSLAKMKAPQPVDDDPRRERIGGVGDPFGERLAPVPIGSVFGKLPIG